MVLARVNNIVTVPPSPSVTSHHITSHYRSISATISWISFGTLSKTADPILIESDVRRMTTVKLSRCDMFSFLFAAVVIIVVGVAVTVVVILTRAIIGHCHEISWFCLVSTGICWCGDVHVLVCWCEILLIKRERECVCVKCQESETKRTDAVM